MTCSKDADCGETQKCTECDWWKPWCKRRCVDNQPAAVLPMQIMTHMNSQPAAIPGNRLIRSQAGRVTDGNSVRSRMGNVFQETSAGGGRNPRRKRTSGRKRGRRRTKKVKAKKQTRKAIHRKRRVRTKGRKHHSRTK